MNIYLGGGMKSCWQNIVMETLPQHTYFDPRSHNLKDPRDYTEWDLRHIVKSDLVFAYLEASNPGGPNLALEIGFSYCCSIPIIFIDEKKLPYWNMIYECSNFVTDSFEEGFNYLKTLE